MTLLIAFSFGGCAKLKRPDTDLCGINVPGLELRCYNLLKDYNDDGSRKKDAKPKQIFFESKEAMLDGLNKFIGTDPVGLAHLKAYIAKMRVVCGN